MLPTDISAITAGRTTDQRLSGGEARVVSARVVVEEGVEEGVEEREGFGKLSRWASDGIFRIVSIRSVDGPGGLKVENKAEPVPTGGR